MAIDTTDGEASGLGHRLKPLPPFGLNAFSHFLTPLSYTETHRYLYCFTKVRYRTLGHHVPGIFLNDHLLKGIRIPSEREENQRILTRTREQLVQDRTAVKNKIRMKCHQMGIIDYDDNRVMTHKLVKEVLKRSTSSELTIAIKAYWQIWKSLDTEIRQIESYTGLTPCEYSSGEAIRRGHISKQGNSRLRAILVEAAWRAIKIDSALAEFFNRLYPRRGKTRAIVAVARKLIGRIRAAFKQGRAYQLGYSSNNPGSTSTINVTS